jgi:Myb-like DNA-binding domain
MYPYNDQGYGRLYIRTRFCSILVDAVSEDGYLESSLVAWEPTDWQDFLDDLTVTQKLCLQPDCNRIVGPDDNDDEEGEKGVATKNTVSASKALEQTERLAQSQVRAQSMAFHGKYNVVEKACQVNMCVAPIRSDLEQQIRAGSVGSPQGLSPERIQTVFDLVGAIPDNIVKKHVFRLFVSETDVDDPVNAAVDKMKDKRTWKLPPPTLKRLEELKEIFRNKPFCFDWFQNRTEQLMWSWNEACFGLKQPYLQAISYHDTTHRENYGRLPSNRRFSMVPSNNHNAVPATPTNNSKQGGPQPEILATLKRRREALKMNHGDDPLIESRQVAAKVGKRKGKKTSSSDPVEEVAATTKSVSAMVSKNFLYHGKKSNLVMTFDDTDDELCDPASGTIPAQSNDNVEEIYDDDDDDDIDSDDEDGPPHSRRVRLPTLPKKRRVMSSPSRTGMVGSPGASSLKMYSGPPPDEGIFDEKGNVVRRHMWTEEEIAALLLGLDKYGIGKWVHIKQDYAYILRNRTAVQIKDKFRTMKKTGELPDRYMM